jgi:hypothetical protein
MSDNVDDRPRFGDPEYDRDRGVIQGLLRGYYQKHPYRQKRRTEDRRLAAITIVNDLVAHLSCRLPELLIRMLQRAVREIDRGMGGEKRGDDNDLVAVVAARQIAQEKEHERTGHPLADEIRIEWYKQAAIDLDRWLDDTTTDAKMGQLPSRRDSHAAELALRIAACKQRVLIEIERVAPDIEALRQLRVFNNATLRDATLGEAAVEGSIAFGRMSAAILAAQSQVEEWFQL